MDLDFSTDQSYTLWCAAKSDLCIFLLFNKKYSGARFLAAFMFVLEDDFEVDKENLHRGS
jgi:hypothetical protein